jgi:hypothetical protein
MTPLGGHPTYGCTLAGSLCTLVNARSHLLGPRHSLGLLLFAGSVLGTEFRKEQKLKGQCGQKSEAR